MFLISTMSKKKTNTEHFFFNLKHLQFIENIKNKYVPLKEHKVCLNDKVGVHRNKN